MRLAKTTNFRIVRDHRGVVTAELDVPGRAHNVLSEAALAELQDLVSAWEHDASVRLIVFRSAKPSGFSAGGDLREVRALPSRQAAEQVVIVGQKLFDRLERLAAPTVAVIHGPCLGGGLELALACRHRIARNDQATWFRLPEMKFGLLPAWGATQRMPQLVGLEATLQMLLAARKVSARRAFELGLVDAIYPPEGFPDGVEQFIAARLAGNPLPPRRPARPARNALETRLSDRTMLWMARRRLTLRGRHSAALQAMLAAIRAGLRRGRAAGLARERELFPELLFSPFCRRRLARFLDRSPGAGAPCWVDGLTIGAALRETARRWPGQDAVVFPQAAVRMTWAEFDRRVDRVAAGLLALGFHRGDHFGVWSTNWPEWVLLQFATARIGLVLVCLNPAYRSAELEYTLGQSEVRGLALVERRGAAHCLGMLRAVCPELDAARPGELHSARFPQLQWVVGIRGAGHPGVLAWPALEAAGEGVSPSAVARLERELSANDPVNLQYTSGTTGVAKGVVLSHRNLLLNAFYTADCQRLGPRDRICIPVPLYHCFGCALGTMCAAVCGAAMVFPHETFDAAGTLATVEQERCTAIYGVPTMFIAELQHPDFGRRDLRSLRTGIMAGSPCPIEVMRRVVEEMGAREITIAYGQTETSPLITMTRTDDPIEKRVGSVGRPIPGVEVKITAPGGGAEVGEGRSGELCCRGHNVMLGYYRQPEATAEVIDADGWLHTGDLALREPDGYFRITGRMKEMIIRGGENIAPREIEELLYRHPKVEQVSVVGVPDRMFGEEVLAWIKLRAGESATAEEIRDYCRQRLAHFKAPHYIQFVDRFPTTTTGKVQKYKIRQAAIVALGLQDVAAIETA